MPGPRAKGTSLYSGIRVGLTADPVEGNNTTALPPLDGGSTLDNSNVEAAVCLLAADKYPYQSLVINSDVPHCIPLGQCDVVGRINPRYFIIGIFVPIYTYNVQVIIDSLIRDEMRSHCRSYTLSIEIAPISGLL